MSEDEKAKHGGSRTNAGRKAKFLEPTKVIRVPESQVEKVRAWLAEHHKTGAQIDLNASLKISQISVNDEQIPHIPMAIERVAAGSAAEISGHVDLDQMLDLNQYLVKNHASTFIVRANSLSMLNAGIDINDPLVVDRSLKAKSGDIVIALIDNEFTLKRLMIESHSSSKKIWLKAENSDFQNIYIEEGQELSIWGVVTYNLKPMR